MADLKSSATRNLAHYREIHRTDPRYGRSSQKLVGLIADAVRAGQATTPGWQPKTLLDFGCGKSQAAERVAKKLGLTHFLYDPAIPGLETLPVAQADLVIYNSQDTRQRSEAQIRGRIPPAVVAHLGLDLPAPDGGELPAGLPPKLPFFVVVGTIEPRKNHGFLLDLWQQMGPNAPLLLICGARGWNNNAVFDRLDRLPAGGPVREFSSLSDAGLAALVQGAAGMLFPSHAEGFGLPPAEALSLGSRVLCNDLPVLHEVLGDKAVYAALSEPYSWIRTIEEWAASVPDPRPATTFIAPTWAEHFKTVLKST